MKERPIIFNDEMVRAILDGRKTQTRRLIKTDHMSIEERDDGSIWPWREDCENGGDIWYPCPYGKPGDRLWVRETWRYRAIGEDGRVQKGGFVYRATESIGMDAQRWKPSIHMPRWASRITLEITNVRVDRVRNISEEGASAEGIFFDPHAPVDKMGLSSLYRIAYRDLWQSIYGPNSWAANPWVWVIEFRRVE